MMQFILKNQKDEPLASKNTLYSIPVEQIRRNPHQPRKIFDEKALFELAESIRSCGVIQPLNVRKIGENAYELISGERRLKASKLIGLKKVPAIIMNIEDERSAVFALIENLQREDLSFFEEAVAYERLLKEFSLTQDELAFKLGKSQSAIANKLRLLKLSEEMRSKIAEHNLTERHCRALLRLSREESREKVLKFIIEKNLNVTDTEKYIDELFFEEKKEKIQKKRVISLFKDIRIFSNTVNQAVDMMKKAGIEAKTKKRETEEFVEYFIRIEKNKGETVGKEQT